MSENFLMKWGQAAVAGAGAGRGVLIDSQPEPDPLVITLSPSTVSPPVPSLQGDQ